MARPGGTNTEIPQRSSTKYGGTNNSEITLGRRIVGVAGQGGTDFLSTDNFDDTDGTYYFYGGELNDGAWKINRYHKTTFVKESADEDGNPSYTTLAAAWTDRLTLTYA